MEQLQLQQQQTFRTLIYNLIRSISVSQPLHVELSGSEDYNKILIHIPATFMDAKILKEIIERKKSIIMTSRFDMEEPGVITLGEPHRDSFYYSICFNNTLFTAEFVLQFKKHHGNFNPATHRHEFTIKDVSAYINISKSAFAHIPAITNYTTSHVDDFEVSPTSISFALDDTKYILFGLSK